MARLVFFPLLLLTLVACTPAVHNSKSAEGTPEDQLARIATETQDDHKIMLGLNRKVCIEKLDGKYLMNLLTQGCPKAATLGPRRHYLTARYAYMNSYATVDLWFDAEPGRNYLIRREVQKNGVMMWIEDLETGDTVGGIPGGEPPLEPENQEDKASGAI